MYQTSGAFKKRFQRYFTDDNRIAPDRFSADDREERICKAVKFFLNYK